MIKLKYKCKFPDSCTEPFVQKCVLLDSLDEITPNYNAKNVYVAYINNEKKYICKSDNKIFYILSDDDVNFDGDVFLFVPSNKSAIRLIRKESVHNTLLFTERCDQLCVMCSQPPRNINDRWLSKYYLDAILLAEKNQTIGISGGEPTLYKQELFNLLEHAAINRPDLSFHILSNGQHFSIEDRDFLENIHKKLTILWGIPLYSDSERTHDEIVQKKGAYETVLKNLFLLASFGGQIELRTVLMLKNYADLPHLAKFIASNLKFINFWAIMGLEPIGFAKASKDLVFVDYVDHIQPLTNALKISSLKDFKTSIYNIPICLIPMEFQKFCTNSISDWKQKYVSECQKCIKIDECPGFFEWHDESWAAGKIKAIR